MPSTTPAMDDATELADVRSRLQSVVPDLHVARKRQLENDALLRDLLPADAVIDPLARRRARFDKDAIDRAVFTLEVEEQELRTREAALRERVVASELAAYIAADAEDVAALDAALTKATHIDARRRQRAARYEATTGRSMGDAGLIPELDTSNP